MKKRKKSIKELISGALKGKTKSLDLSNYELTIIPEEVFEIKNLVELRLNNNKIKSLSKNIKKLRKLNLLFLDDNNLNELPDELAELQKLEHLAISANQFEEIPEVIFKITGLKYLYILENKIKIIPENIVKLPLLRKLNASNNPLIQPPDEIVEQGIENIQNYYKDLREQGEGYVYEAKLILVGEAEAGKTSLSNKLRNPKYELIQTQPMTKGIEVEKWEFSINKEDFSNLHTDNYWFRSNIWDFGGQEIMHATHRYFLTKRSLYVLVVDIRAEKTDFFYWLNIIELFSGKSPIIIVLNEKHGYRGSVPEAIVSRFNESVKQVINVNLKKQ